MFKAFEAELTSPGHLSNRSTDASLNRKKDGKDRKKERKMEKTERKMENTEREIDNTDASSNRDKVRQEIDR